MQKERNGRWPADAGLVRCTCPLLALSGHGVLHCTSPLSGVMRTCAFALHMSAYDPKRTCTFFGCVYSEINKLALQPTVSVATK